MFVKICCISTVEEAELAIAAGATALGLVSAMPSGPGVIADERIREIAAVVGDAALTVLLTQQTREHRVVAQQRHCGVGAVQLVDRYEDDYAALRRALGDVRIIQVVHVVDSGAVSAAMTIGPDVDMILLDSGRPDLERRELGGTGRVHDWRLSRTIVARAPCPVLLAGGLTPENVAVARADVAPYGFDVCSGVRSDDRLDAGKLGRFFRALHGEEADS